MKVEAATPAQYLAKLPEDRRKAIAAVRDVINRHLPKGYREGIGYGMLTWSVPLEVYPDTYNGQPLMYAALGSQKQYMALYLLTVYGDQPSGHAFRAAYAAAGKKLDMGKSCVRFRSLEDLVLPAVGKAIAACPMREFIARAQAAHSPAARAKRSAERAAKAKGAAKAKSVVKSKPTAKPKPKRPAR